MWKRAVSGVLAVFTLSGCGAADPHVVAGPTDKQTTSSSPTARPSAGSTEPVSPRASAITEAPVPTCRVGPLLTASGGRRWWSEDKHCYRSPWFAGRHRIMLGYGCTPAPYYSHDPRCPGTVEGFHHGIDVDMPEGTPIFSAVNGVVVSSVDDGPAYGTQPVNIAVGEYEIVLGHVSQRFVTVGERVRIGQLVAYSGQSGAPDGPHLHFEVRTGIGKGYTFAVNPWSWLQLRIS